MHLPYKEDDIGSSPILPTKSMRDSYSGNTLAFQAKARSSILLSRSKISRWCNGNTLVSKTNILGSSPSRDASNTSSYRIMVITVVL